jgi:hydrogenase maturation protease
MGKRTININVPVLARVEGEGALELKIHGQHIDELRLRIYEPPRYFEKLLEGRNYYDVPDAVARICGICPVAYQMSAVQAIESIFQTETSPWTRAMRRVMYCGEWLQSHSLHIHMLAAPDFLGFNSIIEMAEHHAAEVRRGLMLQTLGNDLITLFGGRSVHPVGVRTGGFYKAPSSKHVQHMLARLQAAVADAEALVGWTASLDLSGDEQDFVSVALRHKSEYPLNEGRIVSDQGLDIGIDEFEAHFRESQVPHSTALHCLLHDRPYLLGPLARINLNRDRLPEAVSAVMDATGIHFPSRNMFHSIIARAVEIHLVIVEAIRLLENYSEEKSEAVESSPVAGTGFGCTEAPRGLLWHRYELDGDGLVKQARIVPPTSQNQARIEEDLRRSLEQFGLQRDAADLRLHAEKVIRNYDPCISCATHFLRLDIEHPVAATVPMPAQRIVNDKTKRDLNIRVIGIGAPVGADRLGLEVVQQLERDSELQEFIPERLTFCTLENPGTGLLELLKNSERVILVDALAIGSRSPSQHDQVTELTMEELAADDIKLSSHSIGIKEVLALHHVMENRHDRKSSPGIIIFGLNVNSDIDTPCSRQFINELSLAVKKKLLTYLPKD